MVGQFDGKGGVESCDGWIKDYVFLLRMTCQYWRFDDCSD